MYKCARCSSVFGESDKRREDIGGYETGVGYYPHYEHFNVCPVCGSDEIDEAVRCENCGEYVFIDSAYLTDRLEYLCMDCKEESEVDVEQ